MTVTIHIGDCLEVMRTLADNSVDAIVTDPPYGLEFMGKDWDSFGGDRRQRNDATFKEGDRRHGLVRHGLGASYGGKYLESMRGFQAWCTEWAREALRIAKPGAHLLAFGGSRTYHRLTSAIEDAGWEIRDSIMWIYGSGFPKSKNGPWGGTALKPAHEPIVMARKPLVGTVAANVAAFGTGGLNIAGCRVPTEEQLRVGAGIVPCRHDEATPRGRDGEPSAARRYTDRGASSFAAAPGPRSGDEAGRWPANVIHDGADEVLSAFPYAPGQQADLKGHSRKRVSQGVYGDMAAAPDAPDAPARKDTGSAARFFYCAKASTSDREAGLQDFERQPSGQISENSGQHITRRDDGYERPMRANTHPTVKPTDLMRYLCRLVTPEGGVVLDPFMGSGSSGRGATLEDFGFIGIEKDAGYAAIAAGRIAEAELKRAEEQAERVAAESQFSLFAEESNA